MGLSLPLFVGVVFVLFMHLTICSTTGKKSKKASVTNKKKKKRAISKSRPNCKIEGAGAGPS